MIKNAMIIIAVSKYEGDLDDLPGTLVSAQRMRDWAEGAGPHQNYNVLEVSDRDGKQVTIDRVRHEVNQFLSANIIDRLVVYFAGHGIVGNLASQYWLLSKAVSDNGEGINVERFRSNLEYANIGGNNRQLRAGQLILICDACRNAGRLAQNFTGHPVFTSQTAQRRRLRQDRYYSTLLGDVSLHIKKTPQAPDYCLFSELVVEALRGEVDGILTRDGQGGWSLANHDFAHYLEDELPIRSKALTGTRCEADTHPGVPSNEPNIYASGVTPPQPASPPRELVDANRMGPDLPTQFSLHDVALKMAASTRAAFMVRDDVFDESAIRKSGFRFSASQPPTLIVEAKPGSCRLWAPERAPLQTNVGDRLSRIRMAHAFGEPLILESEGSAVLVPQYPNVIAFVSNARPDDILIFKLNNYQADAEVDTILSDQFNVANGTVLRMRDAERFADHIRREKHSYPHHAVAAAYLYEFSGDHENILRTAHFMVRDGLNLTFDESLPNHGGLVPFDLALLCAEQIRWERADDGSVRAYADLPEVERAEAQGLSGRAGRRPGFTFAKFERAENVPLWGAAPVFRQGWSYLEYARHLDIPGPLREIAASVSGSSATKIDQKGLEIFSSYFNYTTRSLKMKQGLVGWQE